MTESDGSILQKILNITAPPHSSPTPKLRGKRTRSHISQPSSNGRGIGVDNHSYCDACGDGGDLLCCERCPASFHFGCCDPPMSPANLPDGEWLCHSCRPAPSKIEANSNLLRPLLLQAYSENPQQFFLPDDIVTMATIPEFLKVTKDKSDNTVNNKYCYSCQGTSKSGQMASCNFCPLSFHLECLTPPLTNAPLGSSWMCPSHSEHAMPDLHDSRLTKRLSALQQCRADLAHHAIKMDFITRLKEIPHYKRLTLRTNRRTTEVPAAIKQMYTQPTEDSRGTPAMVDLLLSAAEHVEWMRRQMEEERRRLELQQPSPLTHDEDEWTRHEVVNHVANHHSTLADLREILPSELLPEHTLNGLVKQCDVGTSSMTAAPSTPDVSQLDSDMMKLLASQRLQQLFAKAKPPYKTLNGLGESFSRQSRETESSDSTVQPSCHLQSSDSTVQPSCHLQSSDSTVQPSCHLQSAKAVLCPFSYSGPVYPIHKYVVTIGTGSDMDVCLKSYGHCNYVSLHHACLLLDQVTDEYELVNYSEHGSIVDGVLYSCDFSDKAAASSEAAAVLMLDDLTARGDGIRAERAKRRLEAARRNLRDKERAKRAIDGALNLSRSLSKDCVLDPCSLSGSKRPNDTLLTLPGSPPPSSVVSIPLAKARKSSPAHRTPERGVRAPSSTKDSQPSSPSSRSCMCKRSASSVLGCDGKGWEGAANLYHGSRLRFGCIQLVLSTSGRPGHTELLHALKNSKLT